MDREEAFRKLRELYSSYAKKKLYESNEAETRLLFVDKVLSVLGWDDETFNPESKTKSGQYIDYLLSDKDVPRFIVEAKRTGVTFSSSQNLKKNTYKLGYVRSAFTRPFAEALEQANRYVIQTRVPFAIITNGFDWILVNLLPKPGINIDEQKCFCFKELLGDGSNFDLFWNLLNRNSVVDGKLEEEFSILNPCEAEYSMYPRVSLGSAKWKIVEDDGFVPEFYNFFFDEIVDSRRRKMLEMCFVSNTKLDQYEGELKRALQDVSPTFLENSYELTPGEQSRLVSTTGDQKGRVVLVVGSIGAGKSTFLTKVRIDFREQPVNFVYVDLINEITADAHNVNELWGLSCAEWRSTCPESTSYEELKQVFHSELELLRHGAKAKLYETSEKEYIADEAEHLSIWSSSAETFLKKSWRYQIKKSKHIVLVIDNVDRASEEYQRLVYAFAHKIADETGASVIVTMREGTYFRAKEGGFLDVRSNDLVFHLQSPDVTQILSKRIQYIEKHIDKDFRVKQWKQIYEWDDFVGRAKEFAAVLKKSFLHDRDGMVSSEILAAVSWHNVRKFLDLLKRIHVSLSTLNGGWKPNYVIGVLSIPSSYDGKNEISTHLFDPTHSRQRSYFIKLRLLVALCFGYSDGERRRGVPYKKLMQFSHSYGYRDAWTQSAITYLVRDRFLECMEVPSEEDFTKDYTANTKHSYRVSPLGVLVLQKLLSSSIYLTLSAWDMPFYNDKWLKSFVGGIESLPINTGAIDSSDLDEISNVNISEKVFAYLEDCFGYEQIMLPAMRSYAEVAIVEDWISNFLHKNPSHKLKIDFHSLGESSQLPLWKKPEEDDVQKEVINIGLPDKIASMRVHGSGAVPKIFWALAHLHSNGVMSATGAEITRIINIYILDDQQPVEPTNISRALRSKVMQSQSWLIDKRLKGKRLFSLRAKWEQEWKKVFGVEFQSGSFKQQQKNQYRRK